jgi:S-adenosyl methyltransferase
MLVAVVHLHGDDLHPYETVARYMCELPSGQYLVMNHLSSDLNPAATEPLARAAEDARADDGFHLRSEAEFGRFFDGLELVEPGVVSRVLVAQRARLRAPMWSAPGRKA